MMVDVGPGAGALVIYTDNDLRSQEIETIPNGRMPGMFRQKSCGTGLPVATSQQLCSDRLPKATTVSGTAPLRAAARYTSSAHR